MRTITLLLLVVLVLSGCGAPPAATPAAPASGTPSLPATTPSASSAVPTSPLTTTRPSAAATANWPGPALAARIVLAQQLHLDPNTIQITSADRVDWPDACLGVQMPSQVCAAVITPGYKVVLDAQGKRYEFHTDEGGVKMALAAAPAPEIRNPVLTWQEQSGGQCSTAIVSDQSVVFGPCQGVLATGQYAFDQRVDALKEWEKNFSSFQAQTPAGSVVFTGTGTKAPTPSEQRMVAEWARLVSIEAAAGRSGASYGLVLAWHREGGPAGYCDDLSVYVTGDMFAASCKGGQSTDLGQKRLTADQLQQMFVWVDKFKSFEVNPAGPATPGPLVVRTIFSGAGQTEPSPADQQAIQDWAAGLFAQWK